jgi:alpha-L-fucosidase
MAGETQQLPIASGPFAPNWDSLKQYQAPQWYRDAKFGIWAHWDAQCVPEQGDWYARKMYMQGDADYAYQVAHYGHPSKVGFKDIDRIWKAERWEPEKLIDLYKRAGAKFFMSLANHHDNFDCFDSTYQPWNAVNLGPKRDIVGGWARAARAAGLRFGCSVHASRAWSWYEVAQGADKTGPLAGVPYDGTLHKADGKGTWWEGYDPQDLYAQNHTPGKGGLVWSWDPAQGSSVPDAAYCTKFYNRTIDLINKYQPDLLYFDDSIMPLYPFSDVGLKIAAHYYNSSISNHGGAQGVMTGKGLSESQRQCLVWDMERGWSDRIEPLAWQTDTCIGDWHYNRSVYEQRAYKSPSTVIHMLADIVSKNGNLQLSIPVRGDGTIDELEVAFLEAMAAWMDINSEAIFGTRPWSVYGQGPSTVASTQPMAGNFNEGKRKPLGADDVRFTTRGDTLYAIMMGWPAGESLTLTSLGTGSPHYPGDLGGVTMLGSTQKLKWERTGGGLSITLPATPVGKHAYVLKIAHAGG